MTCFISWPTSFETTNFSLRIAGLANRSDPEYFDELRHE